MKVVYSKKSRWVEEVPPLNPLAEGRKRDVKLYNPGPMPRSDEERVKHNDRVVNSHRTRRKWMHDGTAKCAVCDWTGPLSLQGKYGLVQSHHVRGVGSTELIHDIEHQIQLCPNHHVVAHRISRSVDSSLTKDELVSKLRELDREGSK